MNADSLFVRSPAAAGTLPNAAASQPLLLLFGVNYLGPLATTRRNVEPALRQALEPVSEAVCGGCRSSACWASSSRKLGTLASSMITEW